MLQGDADSHHYKTPASCLLFRAVICGLLPSPRQIAAKLPANALHRLKSDLGVITTKTVSWPTQRVEQIVQANDQWLQMSGNIRQLSELG